MPGTTTPSASTAKSQSQQRTTKPARRRKAIAAVDTQSPLQFSDLEIRVALAFRQFKADLKQGWVETFERVAENYQREAATARTKPMLRIVVGGVK